MKDKIYYEIAMTIIAIPCLFVFYNNYTTNYRVSDGYELRGKLYVENCPQCKTYQGLECYEDLNKGQESIEKNCIKCDYSYRKDY